jgi:serine/threonine protein phosphatase PrpC
MNSVSCGHLISFSAVQQYKISENGYVAHIGAGNVTNILSLAGQQHYRPQMRFSVQAAGKTDVGCVRANNEDNFGYDLEHRVFVLCDGMGGEAAGEVASSLAVTKILAYFNNCPSPVEVQTENQGLPESASLLRNAIQVANQAVYKEALANPEHTGMGTTVVAVLFGEDSFSVAHLGDSRLYRVRGDVIQQLTTDHSVVMEQVRRGLLTIEEAGRSQMQNLITRALGLRESVEPELGTHPALPGDVLLLCSDGFSRFVPEKKTLELLAQSKDLQQCCDSLVETAKQLGSDDNITCVLVRILAES